MARLLIALFAVALVGGLWLGGASAPKAAEAVPVSVIELGRVLITPERDAPALAVALNDTRLSAEISGVIESIEVVVGDRVTAGQLVARLDCERHEIEVVRAEAALEAGRVSRDFADQQLENARQLSAKRSISREELDKREADARTLGARVRELEAALEAARLSVRQCALRAPLAAVVIERIASLGDYVVPGTPVLRLLDDENIEVSARVQEQDLASLEAAERIEFVGRAQRLGLRPRTLLPLLETRLRTYEVRLSLVEGRLAPGTSGRLRWVGAERLVPSDYLVRRDGVLGVFVLEGETARFVALAGARPGHPAPLDLPAETRLILDGRFQLADGDRVRLP
ncbi:MAG: efflux RND transporter periplasmic adaptor subunit [Chromatiaceae bacterium]|nr:efflux RND transporter periplasmic adaptor subunit [Chromatiaceae bacterium]